MNRKVMERLFIGLIVIAIGVVFLLDRLGFDISIRSVFSDFWPVILIALGVNELLKKKSDKLGGLIMTGIGVIFLGRNLDWFAWSIREIFSNLWPLAIIAVGVSMIWKPKKGSKQRLKQRPPENEWESYPSKSDDDKVPPAPPLHPDPTKGHSFDENTVLQGSAERQQADKQSYTNDYTKHKEYEYQGNRKKEHVEWWTHDSSETQTRSGFIGDIHIGEDYWELKPLNISHFIGDTVLDLTKAYVEQGETRITISSFIGDVKVYVPNDYEIGVQVQSSAFIGDVKILGRKEGGMFNNVNIQSPSYIESDKKIKLIVSTFIGDVRVSKVG